MCAYNSIVFVNANGKLFIILTPPDWCAAMLPGGQNL